MWIKRDDRSSLVYGGGKVRKLEWLLANPPFVDASTLWTVGGIGSHHLVALALHLQGTGKQLHALTFAQKPTPHVRTNLAVLASLDTRLWHVRSRSCLPWGWLKYRVLAAPPRIGRYLTPGASSGIACLGFVEAALELDQQVRSGAAPRPTRVYVSAGTAGAAAGLAIGFALAGMPTELRLVSSVERIAFNHCMFDRKLAEVFAVLRSYGTSFGADERSLRRLCRRSGVTWTIDHRFVGAGYGEPTVRAHEAVALASEHGIVLETTYTGKCVAALRHDLGSEPPKGPVLFWNTHAGNDLRAHIRPAWENALPPGLARWLTRQHEGVRALV